MHIDLEVYKRVCYRTIMTHDEEVVKRVRLNDPKELEEFMEDLHETYVAMEVGCARCLLRARAGSMM